MTDLAGEPQQQVPVVGDIPSDYTGQNRNDQQQQNQAQDGTQPPKNELPPWLRADKISASERLEIVMYKVVTFIPVAVTFGLLTFLFVYYVFFYLYPSIIGDFYNTIGLPNMWANKEEIESDQFWSKILLFLFLFASINLFTNIILTIRTSPGYIPDNGEWEMQEMETVQEEENKYEQSDQKDRNNMDPRGSNISEMIEKQNLRADKIQKKGGQQEEFTNQEYQEDKESPREQAHFDYRFIKSPAGPLYKDDEANEGNALLEEQPQGAAKKGTGLAKMSFERKKNGLMRMCQRCLRTKPDRCHHCSQCNKCVLKMDHHCPWVANCIGFYNYKYFINMLFYASFSCNIIVSSSAKLVNGILSKDTASESKVDYRVAYFIVTAYVLACVFGFIITGFFTFHLWMISNQYTTIEFCEKRGSDNLFKDKSPYNLGVYRNFTDILGTSPLLWCLPVRRNLTGKGLHFTIREELKEKFQGE